MSGDEARVHCRWCGASIPDANVWTVDAGIIAPCPSCGRFSEATDPGHLGDEGGEPRPGPRRKRAATRRPEPPTPPADA